MDQLAPKTRSLTFMTPEQLKKFIDDFEDDDKLFELDYNLHDRAVQALLDLWNKMICPFDKP